MARTSIGAKELRYKYGGTHMDSSSKRFFLYVISIILFVCKKITAAPKGKLHNIIVY